LDEEYLVLGVGKKYRTTWYRPTCLGDFLILKEEISDAKIIVGNTEVGT